MFVEMAELLVPFTCPRCDYKTVNKQNMRRHFYKTKKPCQGILANIILTEDIKQRILNDRAYIHVDDGAANAAAIAHPRPLRKSKTSMTKELREAVWLKHIGNVYHAVCRCCELTAITPFTFMVKHIVPGCKDGLSTADNMLPFCAMCNHSAGIMNVHDFKRQHFGPILPAAN